MERDFLGMNTKESVPLVVIDDDSTESHQDEAHLSSVVQWPFLNKASTTQQCISYNAGEDDRQNTYAFNQFPGPRFQTSSMADTFEASQKALPVFILQKYGDADRQVVQPFPISHPYQAQRMEAFKVTTHQLRGARPFHAVSHHLYPVSTSSKFSKVHRIQSSPSMMSMTPSKQQPFGESINAPISDFVASSSCSRNTPKPIPKTAQLTIFYDGSVTVYDNVPSEKAQEIMLLASKESNPPSRSVNLRPEVMLPPTSAYAANLAHDGLKLKQPFIPNPPHSPCSALSSSISVTSQKGPSSSDTLATAIADDAAACKTVLPLSLTSQQEAPKNIASNLGSIAREAIMPRAIPQARKASLARFLERRKERVANAAPFPCNKKSPETGNVLEAASFASISSAADNLSSNLSNRDSEESPSTKLEM